MALDALALDSLRVRVRNSDHPANLSEEEFGKRYPALAWRGKTPKDVRGMSVEKIEAAERDADKNWKRLYEIKIIP